MKLVGLALVAASMCGCATMQRVQGPSYSAQGGAGDGYEHCRRTASSARDRAFNASVGGWTLTAFAVGAGTAGTIVPLASTNGLSWGEKVASATLMASAGAMIIGAKALFQRSDAASMLAGEAASVLGAKNGDGPSAGFISHEEAGARCNLAISAWEKSRQDANALASTLLDQQRSKQSEVSVVSMVKAACASNGCDLEQLEALSRLLKLAVPAPAPAPAPVDPK